MNSWIISCNLSDYDIIGAFKELKRMDWKQSLKNVSVGDCVYIYLSKPVMRITYKCIVEEINKTSITIDDSKYYIHPENFVNYPTHMQIKLVRMLDSELLSFDNLKEHGLNGNLQGPIGLKGELFEYISELFEIYSVENGFPIFDKNHSINAFYLPDGRVKVLANSIFSNIETNNLYQYSKNIRSYLKNNGYILNGILIKDYVFNTPSSAISTMLGKNAYGINSFYYDVEKDLKTYFQNHFSFSKTKLIVCNITWMNNYSKKEELLSSNWAYVKEHGFGHEFLNFYNKDGYYYGFTQMDNGKINLKRIDSSSSDDYLDNVTVVWISRDPRNNFVTIVGYYKNARVYGKIQPSNLENEGYYFKAKVEDSYLIPIEDRNFIFPKERKNRPGQSSVWYADNEELRDKIIEYIDDVDNNRIHFVKERPFIEKDDENSFITSLDIVDNKNYNIDDEEDVLPKKKSSKSAVLYVRNPTNAKAVLAYSKYKCNIDSNHETFITRNGKPYMEAHHLIPFSLQKDFDVNLDTKANIVCLCPNCHRKLHYSSNIRDELLKLYNLKKEQLNKKGINISFEELLNFYE